MQWHGNTIEDMPKWDQLAAVQRNTNRGPKSSASMSHKSGNWYEQAEIPRTDAIAKLSVAIKQVIKHRHTPGNGVVGIGYKSQWSLPTRNTEVSGPPTLQGAPRLPTGCIKRLCPRQRFSATLSEHCPVTVVFVRTVQSRMHTSARAQSIQDSLREQ